jgi:hypothetical protein
MKTLRQLSNILPAVPAVAAWYLADLGEAKGKQELFTRQSPQKLKVLREHALIESAVSSNRIEGVEIDQSRVDAVILGNPPLRDRNEEEVRGYRDALERIHEEAGLLPVTEETILSLHALARGEIGDAGKYRTKDLDIIEKYPDGRSRARRTRRKGRLAQGVEDRARRGRDRSPPRRVLACRPRARLSGGES